MKLWVATFKDSEPDGHFLAVGKQSIGMRVYQIDMDGEASPKLTRLSFPTCLRFLDIMEVSDTKKRSLGWIKERYGDLPKLREALDEEPPFSKLLDADPRLDLINGRP